MTLAIRLQTVAEQISNEPLRPNRGGYTLTMREDAGSEAVLSSLSSHNHARQPNAMHIGWGSFRNLDIVAARRSRYVLLCDINQHQLKVWTAVGNAMKESASAEQFAERLPGFLAASPPLRQFAECTQEWLQSDLHRHGSWLWPATPERFLHVRDLFLSGCAAIASIDLRGERDSLDDGIVKLAQELRRDSLLSTVRLDTIYLTNIPYEIKKPIGFYGESNSDWSVIVPDNRGRPVQLSAYERMWWNLAQFCRHDSLVISSEDLSAESKPDDLRWETKLGQFPEMMRHYLAQFSANQSSRDAGAALFLNELVDGDFRR